ncbi:MAG TPA: ABC transporter substrate-binding protein [Polyangiaceae bacterium]|nr:ABC transporter substrate-binding protein [Polyangiaceae bacterium]
MNRVAVQNIAALVAAILLAMTAVARVTPGATASVELPDVPAPSVRLVDLPDGTKGIADRRGHVVPLRNYRHIVSGSSLVDEVLVVLAERERIAAITEYGKKNSLPASVASGLASHPGLSNIESLLSLKPDLVITNQVGDPAPLERLEERGVQVFDLGDMRGLVTLMPNIEQIATLLGRPEDGRRYAEQLTRRLHRVAAGSAPAGSAIYVSIYGGQIYGGATGTSYHDVMLAAGLTDAAAKRYSGWPNYTAEELLGLDPDFVFTSDGMNETLCRQPGLDRLHVCREPRRILTLESELTGDPGPRLLEAAERLRDELDAFTAVTPVAGAPR